MGPSLDSDFRPFPQVVAPEPSQYRFNRTLIDISRWWTPRAHTISVRILPTPPLVRRDPTPDPDPPLSCLPYPRVRIRHPRAEAGRPCATEGPSGNRASHPEHHRGRPSPVC